MPNMRTGGKVVLAAGAVASVGLLLSRLWNSKRSQKKKEPDATTRQKEAPIIQQLLKAASRSNEPSNASSDSSAPHDAPTDLDDDHLNLTETDGKDQEQTPLSLSHQPSSRPTSPHSADSDGGDDRDRELRRTTERKADQVQQTFSTSDPNGTPADPSLLSPSPHSNSHLPAAASAFSPPPSPSMVVLQSNADSTHDDSASSSAGDAQPLQQAAALSSVGQPDPTHQAASNSQQTVVASRAASTSFPTSEPSMPATDLVNRGYPQSTDDDSDHSADQQPLSPFTAARRKDRRTGRLLATGLQQGATQANGTRTALASVDTADESDSTTNSTSGADLPLPKIKRKKQKEEKRKKEVAVDDQPTTGDSDGESISATLSTDADIDNGEFNKKKFKELATNIFKHIELPPEHKKVAVRTKKINNGFSAKAINTETNEHIGTITQTINGSQIIGQSRGFATSKLCAESLFQHLCFLLKHIPADKKLRLDNLTPPRLLNSVLAKIQAKPEISKRILRSPALLGSNQSNSSRASSRNSLFSSTSSDADAARDSAATSPSSQAPGTN